MLIPTILAAVLNVAPSTSTTHIDEPLPQPEQQRERSERDTTIPEHPQAIGEPGVAWYTTWESGLKEAQRSNRPIFFMAAATCTSGVPGTF